MIAFPEGTANYYPAYDADYKLELSLVEQDRCSGIRHDCRRCAVSMTLKTKLGAIEVMTGKEILWVLWRAPLGEHRGEICWQRFQIPVATRKGIDKFDVAGEPIPASIYFSKPKPSERLYGGKKHKSRDRKEWPSGQPGYKTKRPQRRDMAPSRSLSGLIQPKLVSAASAAEETA